MKSSYHYQKSIIRYLFIVLLLGSIISPSYGQRYWIATTSPSNWNDINNWSTISGGSGGASVPGSGDDVYFNGFGGRHGNCKLDLPSIQVNSITVNGYAGTIDLNGNSLSITGATNSNFTTGVIDNLGVTNQVSITNVGVAVTFAGTTFNSKVNVTVLTRNFLLNGSTFNGSCTFQIDPAAASAGTASTGGNTFNGPVSFIVSSTVNNQSISLTSTNPDVFNNTVSVSVTGSATKAHVFRFASGANCTFNGDITLASSYTFTASSNGIYFGNGSNIGSNSTGGTSTLSAGAKLKITSPFQGLLRIEKFIQIGSDDINLSLVNAINSVIVIGTSTFNGNFTADAGRLCITSSTFNGTTNNFIARWAALVSFIGGGNTFGPSSGAGTTTFERPTNSGQYMNIGANTLTTGATSYISGSGDDTYNNSVIFKYSGGGTTCYLHPAYSGNTNYRGGISWDNNSSGLMYFANLASSPSMTFTGSTQSINKTSGTVDFGALSLIMNQASSGTLTLNTPISVVNTNFIAGIINTNTTNYLSLSSLSGTPSNASHVDGPVRRSGGTAFTFPTGNGGIYRPIAISSLSASDTFIAQYFKSAAPNNTTVSAPLTEVSACEYWTLGHTGSATASATIYWVSSDCKAPYVSNTSDLRCAQWNGAQWITTTGALTGGSTNASGSISSSTISSFPATIALSTVNSSNPLPIELLDFDAEQYENNVALKWSTASELNNDSFIIQRSKDGEIFTDIGELKGAGTSRHILNYAFTDTEPYEGKSYYRIQQIDFDGSFSFSSVAKVNIAKSDKLKAHPNPTNKEEKFSTNLYGTFTITDGRGLLIMNTAPCNEIDISSLIPGTYILKHLESGQRLRFIVR